jgi:hypothetical protein
MTWPGLVLHEILKIDSWCSQMTKKEQPHKKFGLLPPKIAESDIISLGHGLVCVDLVGSFTIRTPAKTLTLLALTMIYPATGWFKVF